MIDSWMIFWLTAGEVTGSQNHQPSGSNRSGVYMLTGIRQFISTTWWGFQYLDLQSNSKILLSSSWEGTKALPKPTLLVSWFCNCSPLYTWTSRDGQYWNQIDFILCSQRWRSSIQSAKARPGADCGSDYELLIGKFRLKSKKVAKTTRPFRNDLNQIPYDCTVEVTNRFKGLHLIDRVPDELWTEIRDIVQEAEIKTIPKEKKCKKAKWLSEEGLQIAVNRREVKGKGEKERYTHLDAEFQGIARRDKKAFLSDQCKEIEENNRMGKTRDHFKKIRATKGTF